MDWISVICVWLIIYRISTDVAWMDGPFDLFAHFRGRIVQKFGSNHWISHGVMCPVCISFWVSIIIAIALMEWRILAGAGFVTLAIRRET